MAKGKASSGHKGDKNTERRCGKASKKHPGVAPKAHNGHTVGGYSIKKHGTEEAEKLASLHTRPMTDRRKARHEAKRRQAASARKVEKKTEAVAA